MEIKLNSNAFVVVPEGEQILTITKCEAKPTASPKCIEVEYVAKNGGKLKSSFDLNNEKSLQVLSILIQYTLGNSATFNTNDCDKLVNKKILTEIVHNKVISNKDSEKTLTFANIKRILGSVEEEPSSEEDDDL